MQQTGQLVNWSATSPSPGCEPPAVQHPKPSPAQSWQLPHHEDLQQWTMECELGLNTVWQALCPNPAEATTTTTTTMSENNGCSPDSDSDSDSDFDSDFGFELFVAKQTNG
ncbi:GH12052 [Drosophila grimshawi]|uniref:GH12052 n=1 Tax=Drosophila grimshawi TaxID=7222 RepID=B4JKG3_DROGR|nr:GH12052 [Drosophila grimshawi]